MRCYAASGRHTEHDSIITKHNIEQNEGKFEWPKLNVEQNSMKLLAKLNCQRKAYIAEPYNSYFMITQYILLFFSF